MQIDDFKTWHWVAVGLIAGLAFSLVLSMAGPPFATDELDTVDAATFENALRGQLVRGREQVLVVRFHKDQPVVRNLIVHPPLGGDDVHRYWVTGQLYKIAPQFKNPADLKSGQVVVEQWLPFKYPAPAPYVVGRNGVGVAGTSYPTVAGFLAAVQPTKGLPPFAYRVAWQEKPAAVWSLPPAAGLLVIGVAWPLALGILRRAGMANPVKTKAAPKPATPPPPRPTPAPAAVRVVVAPPPPPPVPVGDDRKYGGEFYPVVKPAHE